MACQLHIRELDLSVNLGWRSAERSQEQGVILNMTITFLTPPAACQTDDLQNTICYAALTQHIREYLQDRHYRLVEHLAAEIYQTAKKHIDIDCKLKVSLTKYPKIGGLRGGVTFEYGDA